MSGVPLPPLLPQAAAPAKRDGTPSSERKGLQPGVAAAAAAAAGLKLPPVGNTKRGVAPFAAPATGAGCQLAGGGQGLPAPPAAAAGVARPCCTAHAGADRAPGVPNKARRGDAELCCCHACRRAARGSAAGGGAAGAVCGRLPLPEGWVPKMPLLLLGSEPCCTRPCCSCSAPCVSSMSPPSPSSAAAPACS